MTRLRIAYLGRHRIPNERAHGIQIMKTCEAMASLGHEVVQFYGNRFQSRELRGVDPYEYHGVERNFKLRSVPVIDVEPLQRVVPRVLLKPAFILMNVIFAVTLMIWTSRHKADVNYTRDWVIGVLFSYLGRPTVVEIHQSGTQSMSSRAMGAVAHASRRDSILRVVTISEGLKKELIRRGSPPNKIVVARGAVDIAKFGKFQSPSAARLFLGLPDDKPIVMYTGHLTRARGVCTLIEAVKSVPEANFVIIGGAMGRDSLCETELENLGDVDNLTWVGRLAPFEVAAYQEAAEILVLPQADEVGQAPMKLYEYLASRSAVIASNIPPFREVLRDGESAVLFEPGSAQDLAISIQRLLEDKQMLNRLSRNGLEIARNWTWKDRVSKILLQLPV